MVKIVHFYILQDMVRMLLEFDLGVKFEISTSKMIEIFGLGLFFTLKHLNIR